MKNSRFAIVSFGIGIVAFLNSLIFALKSVEKSDGALPPYSLPIFILCLVLSFTALWEIKKDSDVTGKKYAVLGIVFSLPPLWFIMSTIVVLTFFAFGGSR